MRRYAIIVVVLLSALLWVGLVAAQSESITPVPYVYRIDIKGCTFAPVNRRQTGFRVQGLTGIVTALHGVADCKTIHATADGGQEIFTDLEIQQVDIARDVVVLSSPALAALPADGLMASPLSTAETLTTTLHVVGYPLGLDKQDSDVIESIRAIESLDDVIPDAEEPADFIKRKSPSLDIDVLNLQAQLLPGHSGAPVIDPNDQLIAVGNGGLRGGTVGRSWAIPWQDVVLQAVDDVKPQLDALAAKDIATLAFSSTYPGQVDRTTELTTYTVQVMDTVQNQPVANAEVLLTHSTGYEIGVTDSKGFHTFQLADNIGIDYAKSQLQVEAVGYVSYSRNVPDILTRVGLEKLLLSAVTPTATLLSTVTPAPSEQKCSFAFLTLDKESEEPIKGANVSVIVGFRQDTGATDSAGYYLSQLPCNNAQDVESRVRVFAEGFVPYNRSFTPIGQIIDIFLARNSMSTVPPAPTLTPTFDSMPKPIVTATKEYISNPELPDTIYVDEGISTLNLINYLQTNSIPGRPSIVKALVDRVQVAQEINEQVIYALTDVLENDEDAEARMAAAESLGELGSLASSSLPALINAQMHDENPKVRQAANEAIQQILREL